MRYFIDDARTLASVDASGTTYRYTSAGWELTDEDLAGPGWRAISASQAVAHQRAITRSVRFGRAR